MSSPEKERQYLLPVTAAWLMSTHADVKGLMLFVPQQSTAKVQRGIRTDGAGSCAKMKFSETERTTLVTWMNKCVFGRKKRTFITIILHFFCKNDLARHVFFFVFFFVRVTFREHSGTYHVTFPTKKHTSLGSDDVHKQFAFLFVIQFVFRYILCHLKPEQH